MDALRSRYGRTMSRVDYVDDPNAPKANSVVPSVVAIVGDHDGRILLIHKTDNNLWALPGPTRATGVRH